MTTSYSLIATALIVLVSLAAVRWYLFSRKPRPSKEQRLPRYLLMFGLVLLGIAAIVIALPVSDEVEVQILGLLGIVISGGIALSSSNILENAMAGLLLRLNRPFVTGDHIRVDDISGRVTERGLFDTEIQTSDRELVSLPNAYLTSEPVTVISHRGALVSVSIPLDNDAHYSVVEDTLVRAAADVSLKDAFTQVLEISDQSIVYRVSGIIDDDKLLITTRSALNRAILERLEEAEIELVGPMPVEISRPKPGDRGKRRRVSTVPEQNIDQVVFDKAEQAETREELLQEIEQLTDGADELNISPEAAEDLAARKMAQLERLEVEAEKPA